MMTSKSQYGSKQQSVKIAQPPISGQQKALTNGKNDRYFKISFKGHLISEWLSDVLNFSKKPTPKLGEFLP